MSATSAPEGGVRTVYIGGTGHSGSTLLDLLLNNHPLIQSTGEVHRLGLYAREATEPCTCGRAVRECPFWLSVEARVKELRGEEAGRPLLEDRLILRREGLGRWRNAVERAALLQPWPRVARATTRAVAPGHHRTLRATLEWYRAIRDVTGARVVVDSTKDPRRLKLLYVYAPEEYRLIYLLRDGRAVTASAIRRTGVTMDAAARAWRSLHRSSQAAQWSIPADRKTRVRYETLCREPERVLGEIFDFLGLPRESGVSAVRKDVAHNIGGNAMRFRGGETTVRLDERWKRELSSEQLATFERVAGPLNRRLGYE